MQSGDIARLINNSLNSYVQQTTLDKWVYQRIHDVLSKDLSNVKPGTEEWEMYGFQTTFRHALETAEGRNALAQSFVSDYIEEFGGTNEQGGTFFADRRKVKAFQ